MASEFNVPQIGQLNPQQPDYFAKLDEGLVQLRVASGVLNQSYETLASRIGKDIIDFLRKKGIDVFRHEVLYEKEEREGNTLKKERTESIGIVAKGRDEVRRIEDLVDSYQETQDQEIKDLRKKSTQLTRAVEDYVDATLQLTKVQPLNETSPEYQTAHFFVVRRDGVYEAHVDLREAKSARIYTTRGNLDPKLFDNDSYLEDFRKQSEGIQANVYLVRNPSSELPVDILVGYAVSITSSQLLKDRQQRNDERESAKSAGQKLVDRVKSAMKFFTV